LVDNGNIGRLRLRLGETAQGLAGDLCKGMRLTR